MANTFSLGDVVLHVADLRLTRAGRTARVTRKAADILLALGAGPADGLTRDALMAAVWRDVVVDDAALKQHVYKLRTAFREVNPEGVYIETVPRGGYRLTMPLVPVDDTSGASEPDVADEPRPAADPVPHDRRSPASRLAMAVGILTITVGAAAAGLLGWRTWQAREEADGLVRNGFFRMRQSNAPGITAATEQFQRALQIRPGLPPAIAGLAEAYSRGSNQEFSHARDLAQEAVFRDPACARCQGVLGYILMTRDWRWAEAEHALREAIRLAPEDPQPAAWLAQWLTARGQVEAAVATAEEAVRLDPTQPGSLATLAAAQYFAGRPADALSAADRAAGVMPAFQPAHKWRYRAFLLLGNDLEAMKSRAWDVSSWSGDPAEVAVRRASRFAALLESGGRAKALGTFLRGVSEGRAVETFRYERAVWKMALDDSEGALEELEAALVSRPYDLMYVGVEPAFRRLRSDARFQAIVRHVLG